MKDIHYAVYLRAREYWNTRFNDIHVPLAYLHGRESLLSQPEAEADIVIPVILLYDVGWKSIPEEEQGRGCGPMVDDESLRRFQEFEGARIADEILSAVNYDPRQQETIVRIIDGRDRRRESLSEEDSLVKDADKMWRFTLAGVEFHHFQFGKPLLEYVAWLGCRIDRWFFTKRAKQMAREILAEVERAVAKVGHV